MVNIRNTVRMNKLLNDLYDYPNMKIYQYDTGFKFSLDSILLAELVTFHKHDKTLLDLCTGNAVIPLVLSTKSSISMFGIELQPEIYQLAQESVRYNHKDRQIQLIQDNINQLGNYFPGNNFDIITCNPPYFRYHHDNFLSQNQMKLLARHEIATNLEEVIRISSIFLKDKGNFYLVHISDRLQEIIYYMEKYQLRIKDLYFVYPKASENSFLVLFRAIKRANIGMKVHEPIYLDRLQTYQGLFEGDK